MEVNDRQLLRFAAESGLTDDEGNSSSRGRRIAVVMTSHMRRATTLLALSDIENQQPSMNRELRTFLVDAGSTDGTREAVMERFPDVQIIEADASHFWNRGMHVAFAAALSEDFDFYFWLNDDTRLEDSALARFIKTSDDLVSGGENRAIVVGSTCDPATGLLTYGGLVRASRIHPLKFCQVEASESSLQVDTMNGNCVLIPRSVAELVGNLDPSFNHAIGDFDYGLRAAQKGCTIWTVPGIVGTCSRNAIEGTWTDSELPFRKRWKKMMSPKGLPPGEWLVMTRRHAGIAWPIFFAIPYARLTLTSVLPRRRVRMPE